MARVVQPALSQQARSLLGTARQGASLLRRANQGMQTPLVPDSYFQAALGGLDVGLGGLGVYNAINDPYATDAQKAMRAGSGLLQGVQGASQLAGYGSVPYADFITAGLSIGDIAANPYMKDDEKALRSAQTVGRTAANYFVPGVGFLVGGFQEGLNNLIFGDNAFHRLRAREGELLGGLTDPWFNRIASAGSPADLQSIFSDEGWRYGLPSGARPVLDGNRVRVTGTHLEGLGPLEDALTNAVGQQMARFNDPANASLLDSLRQQHAARTQAANYLGQHIPAVVGSSGYADPMFLAPHIFDTFTDWSEGRDRMAMEDGGDSDRVAQSDAHLADLMNAAAQVGITPEIIAQAAAMRAQAAEDERLIQANASRSAGG